MLHLKCCWRNCWKESENNIITSMTRQLIMSVSLILLYLKSFTFVCTKQLSAEGKKACVQRWKQLSWNQWQMKQPAACWVVQKKIHHIPTMHVWYPNSARIIPLFRRSWFHFGMHVLKSDWQIAYQDLQKFDRSRLSSIFLALLRYVAVTNFAFPRAVEPQSLVLIKTQPGTDARHDIYAQHRHNRALICTIGLGGTITRGFVHYSGIVNFSLR